MPNWFAKFQLIINLLEKFSYFWTDFCWMTWIILSQALIQESVT